MYDCLRLGNAKGSLSFECLALQVNSAFKTFWRYIRIRYLCSGAEMAVCALLAIKFAFETLDIKLHHKMHLLGLHE